MMKQSIRLKINGEWRDLLVPPQKRLLDVLREDLLLTGTKEGCGIGECGACTVLLNGKAVNACLILVGQVQEMEITTVEALAKDGQLNRLQQNFLDEGAVQCGFCIPGMLMSATALLMEKENLTREEIQKALEGNLCRCTGYKQIIAAIEKTARQAGRSEAAG